MERGGDCNHKCSGNIYAILDSYLDEFNLLIDLNDIDLLFSLG